MTNVCASTSAKYRPELRIPTAAAQTRVVSGGEVWPIQRELSRHLKYMARARISEFESYHLSHAVRSLWGGSQPLQHAGWPMRSRAIWNGFAERLIGSIRRECAGASVYVGGKHAVEGITKSVALEIAKSGIRVNGVAPGPTDTGMLARFTSTPELKAALVAGVSMGRVRVSSG